MTDGTIGRDGSEVRERKLEAGESAMTGGAAELDESRALEPDDGRASEGDAGATSESGLRRVFVIDDSALVADATKSMLEDEGGYAVEVFSGGEAALEQMEALRPDVVLCDLSLGGGMDGFSVASAIRESAGESKPLMIAVTGYDDKWTRKLAKEAGFDSLVPKPLEFEVLEREVRRLAAGRG